MGLPVVVLTNLHKAHGFRISVAFPMTHQVGNCRRKRCTTSSDPSSSQLVATWTRLVVSAEISRAQPLLHEIYWPQQRFAVLRAKNLEGLLCFNAPLLVTQTFQFLRICFFSKETSTIVLGQVGCIENLKPFAVASFELGIALCSLQTSLRQTRHNG